MANFLWFIAGSFISILAGVCLLRYSTFQADVARATNEALGLLDLYIQIVECSDKEVYKAEMIVSRFLVAPAFSLNAHGHWDAANQMAEISERVRSGLLALRRLHYECIEKGINQTSPEIVELYTQEAGALTEKVGRMLIYAATQIATLKPQTTTMILGKSLSYKTAVIHENLAVILEHIETGDSFNEIRKRRAEG